MSRSRKGTDFLVVHGRGPGGAGGATVESRLDHRIAILPLPRPPRGVQSQWTMPTIATSFPRFVDLMRDLGAKLSEVEASSFTVAIDGPRSPVKGTIGRAVADHFGFAHLDTGLLYRAVGVRALTTGAASSTRTGLPSLAWRLPPDDLDRDDLRTARGRQPPRSRPCRRCGAALLDFQERFARREGGAVLDGRDIGTVICPEAEAKLFVTASDEARATRRHIELGTGSVADVLADLGCATPATPGATWPR